MYERELQQLGLSDKEAKVYLAMVELGPSTVEKVAKFAGVKRPTAYVAIEELARLGLASFHERGKKRYIAIESPQRLSEVLGAKEAEFRRQKAILEKILPGLTRLFEYAGERPVARFFEGKEGLRAIQEDFLRTRTREAYEIYSQEDVVRVFSEQERKAHLAKRLKKKIVMRSICAMADQKLTLPEKLAARRYVDANKFPIGIDLTIYGNKVSIASLRGKLIGVIIESKEIADTFRVIFELAWLGAQGPHNK